MHTFLLHQRKLTKKNIRNSIILNILFEAPPVISGHEWHPLPVAISYKLMKVASTSVANLLQCYQTYNGDTA